MPRAPAAATPREDSRLGSLLTRAREGAGLSLRALARAMGVSPATVLEAERGRNPRSSTLEAYLRALPGLSPHALLQASSECAPAASPAAWQHYRELHGFSAARLELQVRIHADGSRREEMLVSGLRSHRICLRTDLHERTLLLSCVTIGSAPVLRSLRFLEEESLGSRHVIEDGDVRHEYRFPAALDRVGISYRRRVELAEGEGGDSMPWPEGTRLDVRFPVEHLRIDLSFEGRPPADVRSAAWLRHQAVEPGDEDILGQLHPDGLPARWKRGRKVCWLAVEQPLVGTCYGLGWEQAR